MCSNDFLLKHAPEHGAVRLQVDIGSEWFVLQTRIQGFLKDY